MKYDAIVLGAGTNGLAMACLLAQKGSKVACLEKNNFVGGLSSSCTIQDDLLPTSFFHDSSLVNRELCKKLHLEKHGLEFYDEKSDPGIFIPLEGSQGIYWFINPKQTHAEILSKLGEEDANGFLQLNDFLDAVRPFIDRICHDPLPNLEQLNLSSMWQIGMKAAKLRFMGKKPMTELLRSVPMCLADFLNEFFNNQILKSALAAQSLGGTYLAPWSPGSTANFLMWAGRRSYEVKGGPRSFVRALLNKAKSLNIDILTNHEVVSLKVDDAHQKIEAVECSNSKTFSANKIFSSLDPHNTFLKLLDPRALTTKFTEHLNHIRLRGTTTNIVFELEKPLAFKGQNQNFIRCVLTKDLDYLERSFDPVKYGELPQNPALEIYNYQSSENNSSNSNFVSVLVHYTPFDLKQGWNEKSKNELKDIVVKKMSEYFETMNIKKFHVVSPKDLESIFNLTGGQTHHGEPALDQMISRPTPETSQYKTPFQNLFVCGSGSHPGGGVTGSPALLAFKTLF